MKTIDIATLTDVVRTNLDELGVNESMMLEGSDDVMLDNLVEKVMGKCADEVHMAAPVHLLDGRSPTASYAASGKILAISIHENVLRLVAFKASDSDYVVTETIPEAFPEARMQLDPYVQGTYDSPKIVWKQGVLALSQSISSLDIGNIELRYYSLKSEVKQGEDASDKVDYCLCVPAQFGRGDDVEVSEKVIYNFYNLVTADILTILGEMDKAQIYYNKAKFE